MKHNISQYIVITVLLLAFVSCIPTDPVFRYDGEHVDCAATAIYSIPGINSSSEDQIIILETDQYGRTLFAFLKRETWLTSGSSHDPANVLGILIIQKSDENNVYFYGEQNYMFQIIPVENNPDLPESYQKLSLDLVNQYYSEEDYLILKQTNNWDQPFMDGDIKLSSAPLNLEKDDFLNRLEGRSTRKSLEKEIGSNLRYTLLRKDKTGCSMYFVLNIKADGDDEDSYEWYMVKINSDGSFIADDSTITQLDKTRDIPSQILDFRNNCGWVNK